MNILITGTGRILYFLGRNFNAAGHAVTIINPNGEECARLAKQLKALIIHGQFTDSSFLEEAGAHQTDLLLAMSSEDHENLATAQMGKLLFNIPRVLTLVNDPDNEKVFEKLGIQAFSVTTLLAQLIERQSTVDEIINLVPVESEQVSIAEVRVSDGSKAVGQRLQDMDLPQDTVIACIFKGDRPVIPTGSSRIDSDDRIILVALPECQDTALNYFTREGNE